MTDTRDEDDRLRLLEFELREHLQTWTRGIVDEAVSQVDEKRSGHMRRLSDRVTQIQAQTEALDRLLRGERGDNGLSSDIRGLKEAEARREQQEERRSRKEWAVLLLVLGLVLSEAVRFFLAVK